MWAVFKIVLHRQPGETTWKIASGLNRDDAEAMADRLNQSAIKEGSVSYEAIDQSRL
jgi:hypothetical protein